MVQTYKFIGPGAIHPKEYFWFAIKDHLGGARTYQHLIPAAAAYHATSVRKLLENWRKTYLDVLNKEEQKLLCTNLRLNEKQLGSLYIFFRVHKFSLNTRLVVSYCRNLLRPLGQLITEWLQPLARIQKSYFHYSFTIKRNSAENKFHQTPTSSLFMQPPCTQTSEQACPFNALDG